MELPVDPMDSGSMEKQMALQQELMAAISHEIRTPVSRLSFALQILQDALKEDAQGEGRKKMLASCKSMGQDLEEINQLVAEIMTYIHLGDGGPRIVFQRLYLKSAMQSLCSQYSTLHPQLSIDIRRPLLELSIDAEPVQLRRACQNLIGNAIKYAKSRIIVDYSLDGDYCLLSVEDDGPGISEADYGRVFAPFTRLDESRHRSTGGFGLGLSIVRRIAFWHGGRAIAGRSKELGGAKMIIKLPVKQPTGSLPELSMAHPVD
ncbi:MAG: ATP-binding protein [Gammaproteobacteria bacterium]|nr:ATP-binding protein [Gammaproteobacteria bacterium]